MDKIYNVSSKRMVTVNGLQYKKLLKEGYYVEQNQLIAPTKVKNPVESTKIITPVISYELPNDMIGEIINHTKTSDLLALCQTNTQFRNACQHEQRLAILKQQRYQTITLSNHNTFFIKNSTLYGVGSNAHGQLGQGKKGGKRSTTVLIPIPNNAKPLAVSCGNNHMLVLTSNGLYGCGHNHDKQLSTQKTNQILTLQPILSNARVLMMQCIGNVSYVLTDTNLYILSPQGFQQIDLGVNTPSTILFIHGSNDKTYIITKSGLYALMFNQLKNMHVVKIPIEGDDILNVSSGRGFVLVLTRTGLYGQGVNDAGQLGLGYLSKEVKKFVKIPIDNVVGIASCNLYSVALTLSGDVYGFGYYGMESGYWAYPLHAGGHNAKQSTPIKINIDAKVFHVVAGPGCMLLQTDQGDMACGYNYFGQLGKANYLGHNGFELCQY